MDEPRIVEIETKLAHQELLLEQLNSALTEQQSQLSRLQALSQRLVDRLQAVEQSAASGSGDDRPPHY